MVFLRHYQNTDLLYRLIVLSLPSPSFADDVTLLALFSSFLQALINLCHNYSLRLRYQFNHIKSGVVTFGECKPIHSKLMKERKWLLGHTAVYELCEYKNLGVLKNYANSFSTNVEDNIEKARKIAGMIPGGFTPKKCLVRRCRSDGSQFLSSGIGMGFDFSRLV